MKGHEFRQELKLGPYTWPGGYPRYLVFKDGQCFCFTCARNERIMICAGAMGKARYPGWEPLGFDVNWEDPELFCDGCSERIESAYAEDEANRAHPECSTCRSRHPMDDRHPCE